MRLRSITLQWFRGAASTTELEIGGNSVAIFGTNGAGKSSFVDGIEAVLNGGKVGHLTHEYSGRHQEYGLINTSRPEGQHSKVQITLVDGSSEMLVWQSGSPARKKQGATNLGHWDYRRTALRQEELSAFIRATKGDKYAAVLPLLGLSRLELVAENLHKVVRAIERRGNLSDLRAKLDLAAERRREFFGDQHIDLILMRLEQLRMLYAPEVPVTSILTRPKTSYLQSRLEYHP